MEVLSFKEGFASHKMCSWWSCTCQTGFNTFPSCSAASLGASLLGTLDLPSSEVTATWCSWISRGASLQVAASVSEAEELPSGLPLDCPQTENCHRIEQRKDIPSWQFQKVWFSSYIWTKNNFWKQNKQTKKHPQTTVFEIMSWGYLTAQIYKLDPKKNV